MGRAEQLLKGLHRNWKLQMPEGFQLPAQDLCPLHQPTAATQRALWGTATPARKAACLGSLSQSLGCGCMGAPQKQEVCLEERSQPRISHTPHPAISLKFYLMCLEPKKGTEVTTSIAWQRLD